MLGELGEYWFLVTQSGHMNGPIMLRHGMSKSRGTGKIKLKNPFILLVHCFFHLQNIYKIFYRPLIRVISK